MDALDVRIIRAMGVQPYGRTPRPLATLRPPAIAKRLGVTPARVKDRIRRMEENGTIAGYGLHPNLRHLGYEISCYFYEFDEDAQADKAMESIRPLEGAAGCATFVGGSMCVMLAYRSASDLERKLRVLVGLGGQGDIRKFFDFDMPAVSRPLSNVDWRIIQAMRAAPMASMASLADEVGVHARTVKRRVDRMGQEGSFFVVPDFDPSAVEGALLFYIVLELDPDGGPRTLEGVHRAFEGHLVSTDVLTDLSIGHYNLFLAARSMAQVEQLRRRAEGLRGVSRTRTFLFRGGAGGEQWLDDAIQQRIEATTP